MTERSGMVDVTGGRIFYRMAGTGGATPLVLVRPDFHVAWRGNAIPGNPTGIIDTIRGA